MRHRKKKYRIGTSSSHRKAILKGLMVALLTHEKIKTTHPKCKAVQPYIEKLITLAKTDSVSHRRQAFSTLGSKEIVKKLFADIAPKYKERNGGYTRVLKMAEGRMGDNAPLSYIAFV